MTSRRFDYWGLVGTLGVWAVIGTLAGYLGGRHWIADLFANARPYYVMLLVPLALAMAVRRFWRLAGLFVLAALLNAVEIAPAWWPGAASGPGLHSLLVLNVQNYNTRYAETRELIEREHPDFVLLMEVDNGWMQALAPLTNRLPYSVIQPRNDNYGIALYSRYRLRRAEVRHPGEGWIPVIDALCDIGGQNLRILGAHAFPPWGPEATGSRNELLHNLAAIVAERDEPTLLAGDLNVTPWSRHFRALLGGSGLTDAARGRGLLSGWPARLPAVLRTRKDYVLAGPGVQVTGLELRPPVGSDHLPLIARFNLVAP